MSRPFVELYIGNKKVEFREPPQVNITYSHSDLHNPTVVKNSFSKTITIDGTPHNNQIFNSFYDMRRLNADGLYNASRRVDFTLYRNGEPMETGYVKLDKVKKKGNNIQYDITLYGGLGQFLYNLQYKEDGTEMKLSDLDYGYDMDLDITKETIKDAWYHISELKTNSDIYNHINFAPCYNGIPKDFSADKVAIDVWSFKANNPRLYEQFTTSKNGYGLVDNKWLLGELNKDYDEWQVKDLRSYLQRPVIRFKDIIQACCKKENNGGYMVDLDNDFFNVDNPYYENAWMTLPLVSEIEDDGGENLVTLRMSGDTIYADGAEDGSRLSFSIPVALKATATSAKDVLYSGVQITLNPSQRYMDEAQSYNVCRYIQLVVYDKNGNVVGGSTVAAFYTNILNATNFNYQPEYNTTIDKITGDYKRTEGNTYIFNNAFYNLNVSDLEWKDGYYMKLVTKVSEIKNYENGWYRPDYPENEKMHNNLGPNYLYERNEYHKFSETVKSVNWSLLQGGLNVDVKVFAPLVKKITKKTLLNSEHTPCDYFLSYLKMFNLHIWKDMYDKTIYVRLRKNYFVNDVYDLEELIDRGSDMTITPITFENKWLNFNSEVEEEDKLHKDYLDEFGIPYGIQKVDTNYNFDSSDKDLFENQVFKTAIQNRGKSRYYTDIYQSYSDDDVFYPPFMLDGCKTYLFNGSGDTTDGSAITPKNTQVAINWWKDKYYDFSPKPNFTDSKNEPVDGANVLLFYNGRTLMEDVDGNRLRFQITDDIPQFSQLNDAEPCWIWSMDWDVSIDYMTYFPVFSRYITNENNWVTHSWDFGTPKYLYVPDYSIDDTSNIYNQYWKPYIRDMYDANTRVVECNVLLKERVIGDWLKRFYYFDGSYWILNKVIDYDVTSNGTTKCEFVRVNDIQNYLQ